MIKHLASWFLIGLSPASARAADAPAPSLSPALLPGQGLAHHPFLYAGE